MGRKTEEESLRLLREAEGRGALLIPSDDIVRKRLGRLVRRGEVFRPVRGAYVRADYWRGLTEEQKALHMIAALSAKRPDIVFSHVSAALVHGLEVPRRHLRPLHALTEKGHCARSDGQVTRHVAETCPKVLVDGILITPIGQTVFDCLRTLDLPEGLAIVDSALRREKVNLVELQAFFDGHQRSEGYRHAARTLSLADPRSENGGESIARGIIIELGYMPPDLQVVVNDPLSGTSYRADFCWRLADGGMVIGELDGREKYTNPEMTGGRRIEDVLLDERLRESRINARGIRVMRFHYDELMNRGRFSELLDLFGIPRVCHAPERLPHPRLDKGVTFRRKAGVATKGLPLQG